MRDWLVARADVLRAAVFGALASANTSGLLVYFLVVAFGRHAPDVSRAPQALVVFNLIGVPAVLFGLLVFGRPMTALFRQSYRAWWLAPLAVVLGSLSVAAVALPVVASVCNTMWRPGMVGCWTNVTEAVASVGLLYGGPAGFWWWLFYRPLLIGRAELTCDQD